MKVFRDRILQLHTTRSWDFLEAESGLGSGRAQRVASTDVIIGIIDTGASPCLFEVFIFRNYEDCCMLILTERTYATNDTEVILYVICKMLTILF